MNDAKIESHIKIVIAQIKAISESQLAEEQVVSAIYCIMNDFFDKYIRNLTSTEINEVGYRFQDAINQENFS